MIYGKVSMQKIGWAKFPSSNKMAESPSEFILVPCQPINVMQGKDQITLHAAEEIILVFLASACLLWITMSHFGHHI